MADNGPARKKRCSSVLSLPDRIFDGYQYQFGRNLSGGARRLYCCKRSSNACNAVGTLSASDNFTYVPGKNRHNHEPDVNSDCKSRFRKDLYIACRYEFRDLQIIYRDISIIHQEATALLSFNQIKPQMQSWQRNRTFPDITSSSEFQSYLAEENFKNIHRHNSGRTETRFLQSTPQTHSAIIFSDLDLLSKVETSQLFIQSSSRNLPEGVGALQLTSISTQYADHIFPVVWIIELEKSENNCKKIAEALLFLKPMISPREIYGDFDDNYSKAMKSVFPEASMKGTFLSHCQIMVDAAVRFGIDLEDDTKMLIFTKIVALSLLPGDKIKTSFYWIISSMTANQRNHFNDLLEYYNREWVLAIGGENYSFFNNLPSLWKNSELLINVMGNRMQNRTIWTFMEHVLSGHNQCHFHLQNLQLKGRMNWNSNKVKNLFNGVKNCKFIVNCWKSMEGEDSDFLGFLRKTSHILGPVLQNIKFVGVVLPAQFNLLKLTVTQNAGQLREIPTLPNDRLLDEATRMDLRAAIDRLNNKALADDAESTNEEMNDDVNQANNDVEHPPSLADVIAISEIIEAAEVVMEDNNDVELPLGPAEVIDLVEDTEAVEEVMEANNDVELPPGPAEIIDLDKDTEAVEEVMEANNDVELPPGPAEVIAINETIEAAEVVMENIQISQQCLICEDGTTPTKLYRPCLHVVTCGPCNKIWFQHKVDKGKLFQCILCRAFVQQTQNFVEP